MRLHSIFTILALLFVSCATLAQDLVTTRQVIMVENSSPSLNSDRKDKLNLSISGRAFTEAVAVPKNTLVKVLSRGQFSTRAMVSKSHSPTPQQVKRDFSAVYVEIAEGDLAGKKGWMVQSVTDQGLRPDIYLQTAPSNHQAQQQASAQASAQAATMPDLTISVSTPDSTIQLAGKKVYDISIGNAGGVTADRGITVIVKVGQKVIETETINKEIRAGGSHRFSVEVSESAIRRGEKLTIMVDTGNRVEESDEKNNTYTRSL
jgi:CARDB